MKPSKTKLEIAAEMYDMAFEIKKTKLTQENPSLSEPQILQKTKEYFRDLKKD